MQWRINLRDTYFVYTAWMKCLLELREWARQAGFLISTWYTRENVTAQSIPPQRELAWNSRHPWIMLTNLVKVDVMPLSRRWSCIGRNSSALQKVVIVHRDCYKPWRTQRGVIPQCRLMCRSNSEDHNLMWWYVSKLYFCTERCGGSTKRLSRPRVMTKKTVWRTALTSSSYKNAKWS